MTLETNTELQRAWQIVEETDTHLFLTGKAGTGKTTFLKQLRQRSPKRMVVVAPTGIAAINAEGVTIHSFFQLSFAPFFPDGVYSQKQAQYRFSKDKKRIIQSIDLLVIDEISMVRADLLDAVDDVLRRFRDHDLPFGGVQLLMIGDLQQLAPVVREDEWSMLQRFYDTPYFFSSRALAATDFAVVELNKVYRQSDTSFLDLLNAIRENRATGEILNLLNRRYIPDFTPTAEFKYIRLTTHNAQADSINRRELETLSESAYHYKAKVTGNFPEYSYPTDELLTLKRGAQVMFVKNDTHQDKRYYNGLIGEVVRIDAQGFTVHVPDGDVIVERDEWANERYELNEETKEITEVTDGTFTQFPVKLAWAITIHKSQGLTFEHAIIDAHNAFAHGQAYVALSRCKTLEGIVLSSPLSQTAIISDHTVAQFNASLSQRIPSSVVLESMKRNYFFSLVNHLFDFTRTESLFSQTERLIDEYFYRLYPLLLKEYKDAEVRFKKHIKDVSVRFGKQYGYLIQQSGNYEEDAQIQDRLSKGADYFANELSFFAELSRRTDLPTDNKELKKRVERTLEDFKEQTRFQVALLRYVATEGFYIQPYLRKKAVIMLGEPDKVPKSSDKKKKISVPTDVKHPILYKKLLLWRLEKSQDENLPAYCVMQQKALLGVVNILPTDKDTLLMIPYLGKKGVEKYGDELIEMVQAYVEESGLTHQKRLFGQDMGMRESADTPPVDSVKQKGSKLPGEKTEETTLRLFKDGMDAARIASERGLTIGTIYGHLGRCVQRGELSIEEVMEPSHIVTISRFLQNLGDALADKSLKQMKEELGNIYGYNEINLVKHWLSGNKRK